MWQSDAVITIVTLISIFLIFEESISIDVKKAIIFSVIIFSLFDFIKESEFHNVKIEPAIGEKITKKKIIAYLNNDDSLYRIFRVGTKELIPNLWRLAKEILENGFIHRFRRKRILDGKMDTGHLQ